MKVIAITQARTGSKRFPNKILKKINGKTLLQIHIDRVKKAKSLNDIIIASTLKKDDKIIEDLSNKLNINCFRGSELDVLDRFYQSIKNIKPNFIVRLTSDCPLIDPILIDEIVEKAKFYNLDYYSNTLDELYPDGQDIEVISFKSLEYAWKNSKLKSDREHVTPFIIRNSSYMGQNLFNSNSHKITGNYNSIRLTVDEQKDFDVIEIIIKKLGFEENWETYADFYQNNNKIKNLNKHIIRNEGYKKSLKLDNK